MPAMKTIPELEKNLIRAAMRWHNYRERYNPIKDAPGYPGRTSLRGRWATDNIHDRVDELQVDLEKAMADLAEARKRARGQ